uniref:glycogenin glucosyltransferase n=1 Tax=Ciona savignyi TaxID=51511 RepID=H2ZQR1_CIOSA
MVREAFVTLVTNDLYCDGALVVAQSLRSHGTKKDIVVLTTPHVSAACRSRLAVLFDHVVLVNILDSNDSAHLALLHRPELGVTFTKIHCWSLTQYSKCVFLDADTLLLTNVDELFERNELSAAPDSGWPDMFNSGVFVFKPSMHTFQELIQLADNQGSFDGGDQGLLNTYFSEWSTSDSSKRLSFLYNMHSTSTYSYSPAFKQFGKDTKIVHFIGNPKPWNHKYNEQTGQVEILEGSGILEPALLKHWWEVCCQARKISNVEKLSPQFENLTVSKSSDKISDPLEVEDDKMASHRQHFLQLQASNVDYTGVDSFDHIQAKLDGILQSSSPTRPSTSVKKNT